MGTDSRESREDLVAKNAKEKSKLISQLALIPL